jgi:hypothetical protein
MQMVKEEEVIRLFYQLTTLGQEEEVKKKNLA